MRILFSSTRGAGHLQPLLPYARALIARQHEVLVAAPVEVGEAVRGAGLTHAPFEHPGDVTEQEQLMIALSEIFAGANARAALPALQATIADWRPDLVVRESAEFGALIAAERAGVRHARVAVHSVSLEESFPDAVEGAVDKLRAEVGLSADQGASLRSEPIYSSFPATLDVVPPGSRNRAPFRARVVEDPPSDAPAAWAAPDDARPLVYITFGSIVGGMADARAVYRTSLDAIADLPVRALLTTGRDMDPSVLGAIPANVHVEAWVPQRDVLPRAKALVHHGGSGTLIGGLAAGLPMVVVPMGADQPHNGRLVAAAGVGLTLTKPDAAALRGAIAHVLEAPEIKRRAEALARDIAAMPTIDDAVEMLLQQG